MSERREYIPPEYQEDAEDPRIYEDEDCVPSCDKGSHKQRSIANQPNHLKHWKKVEDQEDE